MNTSRGLLLAIWEIYTHIQLLVTQSVGSGIDGVTVIPVFLQIKVVERFRSRAARFHSKNLAPPNVVGTNIERLTPKLSRAVWRLTENFNTSL